MLQRIYRLWLRSVLVLALILLAVGPFAFIYSGVYDVAATRQHTAPVYWAVITTLRNSIRAHAPREVPQPPDLSVPALVNDGLVLYEQHCAPCHGAPGRPPQPFSLGLTPPPPPLVVIGREATPRELYWATAKGLKMTGMPAWEYRLTASEIWALVAFLKTLPALSPVEYGDMRAALLGAQHEGGAIP